MRVDGTFSVKDADTLTAIQLRPGHSCPQCRARTQPSRLTSPVCTTPLSALQRRGIFASRICRLPKSGWGELVLLGSTPQTSGAWTDSGQANEDRQLKHRGVSDTRPVPASPELVKILRQHVETFPTSPDGRLFVTRVGRAGVPLPPPFAKPLSMGTTYRVWAAARAAALTDTEFASPLANRPYDLRHAAVSLWLNAGVRPTQVAEWAGHSVNVLLRVYAKCVYGQDEVAKARIEARRWR